MNEQMTKRIIDRIIAIMKCTIIELSNEPEKKENPFLWSMVRYIHSPQVGLSNECS